MEKRLKQQQNRLLLRVTLIVLAVCLSVTVFYCVICLYNEKNSVQNSETARFSHARHELATCTNISDFIHYVYPDVLNPVYFDEDTEQKWDTQIIITEKESQKTIIDTTGKMMVKYGIQSGKESTSDFYGFIDYLTIRNALNDKQYQSIVNRLNTKCSDGKRYELICTSFQLDGFIFVPLELKIALVDENDTWFAFDKITDVFSLKKNSLSEEDIFVCNNMRRNIIPKAFFLNDGYSQNYIRLLTEEQKATTVDTIPTDFLEYIFYATDDLYVNDYIFYHLSNTDIKSTATDNNAYTIQYAKKIRLLDNCKTKLLVGIAVIFLFFLVIAVILCLMIGKMLRTQMLQEQQRTDLTNALAHDIKTPLFVISGYAYSLKENIGSDERDGYLEKIIEQTDNINNLVHKMLNLSRLNSDKMTLNRTDFDLYTLVTEIQENFRILPEKKTITLTHSGNNLVNADRELIKTALQNLTDNAVKYSLPDSEIQITVTDNTFCIANQSPPLTKSDIRQIWQPYIRKDKSRHQNGNGLGLSIVKSIFDLHGITYTMKQENSLLICHVVF